jgi:TatD DNase family protein
MHFVDTHCHVDLYPDYQELLEETEQAGIYTIAVTNTPSVFRRCFSLTQSTKFVRAALGLHPQLVSQRSHELALMLEMLGETKYIGEIGLDFVNNDQQERKLQERVFTTILEKCAAFPEKVLTIHGRRAASDVVRLVGQSYPCTVILHWFSGTQAELRDAIAAGFYFSANSAMLGSEKGRKLITRIPLDRLLTESDGPFVNVDGKSARPTTIPEVVTGLAELMGMGVEDMAETIFSNFRRILQDDRTTRAIR